MALTANLTGRKLISTPTVTEEILTVYLKNAGLERHRYANLLSYMSIFEDWGETDLETLDVSDILQNRDNCPAPHWCNPTICYTFSRD
jgi:hypothetical protein